MISFKAYLEEKVILPAKSKTLGINRKDMPQIDEKDMKAFLKFLDVSDVKYETEIVDPYVLKATQNQFHISKIESIMDKLKTGKGKRILVSQNNYVIDGHHGWIAHLNLGKKIDIIRVDRKAKEVVNIMHDFPKSYTKKLYEDFDVMLVEKEMCPILTRKQLDAFENVVDKLFKKFKIDFDFTKHFRERMGDPRNKPCIDLKELASIIQKLYKQKTGGKNIFAKYKDAEAVIKDLQTDLNLPIAIEYNRKSDELRIAMKTIMRKKNFRTPSPIIKTEDLDESAYIKDL